VSARRTRSEPSRLDGFLIERWTVDLPEAPDGKTIAGRWEKAEDGSNWETDFDLTYTKAL
jgi:hypothetical protein